MSSDEFFIAADMTLYSNPLNRALLSTKTTAPKQSTSTAAIGERESSGRKNNANKNPDEWIASDMTKYDCPLADLDKSGIIQEKWQASKDLARRLSATRQKAKTSNASITSESSTSNDASSPTKPST